MSGPHFLISVYFYMLQLQTTRLKRYQGKDLLLAEFSDDTTIYFKSIGDTNAAESKRLIAAFEEILKRYKGKFCSSMFDFVFQCTKAEKFFVFFYARCINLYVFGYQQMLYVLLLTAPFFHVVRNMKRRRVCKCVRKLLCREKGQRSFNCSSPRSQRHSSICR